MTTFGTFAKYCKKCSAHLLAQTSSNLFRLKIILIFSYLTPVSSAGFAPHWDDIDAFMLQVEGKKYWKVYAPENAEHTLPLDSSQNFTDDDFKERKPIFEGWLEQGDLLYVPRGFVHQVLIIDN
jgi:ribosomal protein L16 Arg81 hydroxylase